MITVVCLSYRRPELLRRALNSILAQTLRPERVLVVDNATDQSAAVAAVVREFPTVTLIANPDNRGFAGGMNTGLRAVACGHVLITEDDLELAPDCLATFHAARSTGDLLGGVLIDVDTGAVEWSGGRLNFTHGYWGPNCYLTHLPQPPPSATEPIRCEFVSGCLLFADVALFQTIGGFREDFFVYGEDVEFCARLQALGRSVVLHPAARALHLAPHRKALGGFVAFHHEKNYIANWFLYAPTWRLPEALLRFVILRFLAAALRDRGAAAGRIAQAVWFWLPKGVRLWGDRRGARVSSVTVIDRK